MDTKAINDGGPAFPMPSGAVAKGRARPTDNLTHVLKDKCIRGHDLSKTRVQSGKGKICSECRRIRNKARYAKTESGATS